MQTAAPLLPLAGSQNSRTDTPQRGQPQPECSSMGPQAEPLHGSPPGQKDLYRDTWVRYLGYANEVGEAFRALVPVKLVWVSYGVATAYVSADAIDKGRKAALIHNEDSERTLRVTVAVVDTFIWQALASVAIPGFTINRICAASLYLLARSTRWPLPVRRWTTTAIGLSAIPVIITPIDRSVDYMLDQSLRKLYNEKVPPGSCAHSAVPAEETAETRST